MAKQHTHVPRPGYFTEKIHDPKYARAEARERQYRLMGMYNMQHKTSNKRRAFVFHLDRRKIRFPSAQESTTFLNRRIR